MPYMFIFLTCKQILQSIQSFNQPDLSLTLEETCNPQPKPETRHLTPDTYSISTNAAQKNGSYFWRISLWVSLNDFLTSL